MKNILLLEDNIDVRNWSEVQLNRTFPDAALKMVETLEEAKETLSANSYDLAILDINLPDGSGIEIAKLITATNEDTTVVMLTASDDDQNVFDSLKAGAQGYLLKGQGDGEFSDKLKGIMNGEPPLTPAIAFKILNHFKPGEDKKVEPVESVLTNREEEVLILIAKGMNRPEIANLLGITTNTAAAHVKSIYRKLNISSRAEAATEANRMGLV